MTLGKKLPPFIPKRKESQSESEVTVIQISYQGRMVAGAYEFFCNRPIPFFHGQCQIQQQLQFEHNLSFCRALVNGLTQTLKILLRLWTFKESRLLGLSL